eukprot:COSAG06_NODE_52304_length_306_cov_1.188406_1_plen_39_part_10
MDSAKPLQLGDIVQCGLVHEGGEFQVCSGFHCIFVCPEP